MIRLLSHFKNNIKIKYKIIIFTTLLFVVSITSLNYISYTLSSEFIKNLASDTFRQEVKQAGSTLYFNLENYGRIISILAINNQKEEFLIFQYENKYDSYSAHLYMP